MPMTIDTKRPDRCLYNRLSFEPLGAKLEPFNGGFEVVDGDKKTRFKGKVCRLIKLN